MPDAIQPSARRSLLLLGSLCLNLLLVVLVVVVLSRTVGAGFIAQPGLAPATIARGQPADEQNRIRDIVADHQPAIRQARQAAQRARQEAFRILAAPDYNARDFAAALDKVRDADGRLEDQAIARLLDTVASLTPQQRQTVIGRVRSGANQVWWRRALRWVRGL